MYATDIIKLALAIHDAPDAEQKRLLVKRCPRHLRSLLAVTVRAVKDSREREKALAKRKQRPHATRPSHHWRYRSAPPAPKRCSQAVAKQHINQLKSLLNGEQPC